MILSELRDYLKQNRRVHLTDLSNHFDTDPSAIQGMLEKWIGKGRVRKVPVSSACGTGCSKCYPAHIQVYEWVNSQDT